MPICSVGGAACCAGPIEKVLTHETEVHGIPHHANPKAAETAPRMHFVRSPLTEADRVIIAHTYRSRFTAGANRSAQSAYKDAKTSRALYHEHKKRGY